MENLDRKAIIKEFKSIDIKRLRDAGITRKRGIEMIKSCSLEYKEYDDMYGYTINYVDVWDHGINNKIKTFAFEYSNGIIVCDDFNLQTDETKWFIRKKINING